MTLKKTNLLVASSSIDEAITRCVLKNKHAFSVNIEVVLIHELITDFNINDELSDHESVIRWFKPNQHTLSNQTHLLLNRTLSISDDLFLNFIQKDRDYAKREFEAYLGYSFNSFKGIGNQTVNGICENLYSLPEQWQKIKAHTALNTPNYYWGPQKLCHLTKRIVYSNIHNVFNWLITPSKPQAFHVFCFEKPKGHPLFALSLGEKTLMTSNLKLSKQIKTQIQNTFKHIRACFGYFIFEVLLFIDNDVIHFGCINLELTRASKHPDFEPFVSEHLTREYFKCLN